MIKYMDKILIACMLLTMCVAVYLVTHEHLLFVG